MRPTSGRNPSTDEVRQRLSRADIECLCILNAVGDSTCTPAQLAERLDLSAELAPVLVDALDGLVASRWLAGTDGQLGGPYAMTEDGRAWVDKRLRAAGLR